MLFNFKKTFNHLKATLNSIIDGTNKDPNKRTLSNLYWAVVDRDAKDPGKNIRLLAPHGNILLIEYKNKKTDTTYYILAKGLYWLCNPYTSNIGDSFDILDQLDDHIQKIVGSSLLFSKEAGWHPKNPNKQYGNSDILAITTDLSDARSINKNISKLKNLSKIASTHAELQKLSVDLLLFEAEPVKMGRVDLPNQEQEARPIYIHPDLIKETHLALKILSLLRSARFAKNVISYEYLCQSLLKALDELIFPVVLDSRFRNNIEKQLKKIDDRGLYLTRTGDQSPTPASQKPEKREFADPELQNPIGVDEDCLEHDPLMDLFPADDLAKKESALPH